MGMKAQWESIGITITRRSGVGSATAGSLCPPVPIVQVSLIWWRGKGTVRKKNLLLPPGFEHRTVHPVASLCMCVLSETVMLGVSKRSHCMRD